MELDEDDAPTLIRLARVGPELVICERAGDRTRSRPHRFTAYQVDAGEPGEPFWMAPENTLFVLHETHFASPPDWRLQLCADPHGCYNWVVAAIHEALEPVERVSFGSIMCGDSASAVSGSWTRGSKTQPQTQPPRQLTNDR